MRYRLRQYKRLLYCSHRQRKRGENMRKEKDIDVQEIVDELPKDDESKKEILFFIKGFNLAKTSRLVSDSLQKLSKSD